MKSNKLKAMRTQLGSEQSHQPQHKRPYYTRVQHTLTSTTKGSTKRKNSFKKTPNAPKPAAIKELRCSFRGPLSPSTGPSLRAPQRSHLSQQPPLLRGQRQGHGGAQQGGPAGDGGPAGQPGGLLQRRQPALGPVHWRGPRRPLVPALGAAVPARPRSRRRQSRQGRRGPRAHPREPPHADRLRPLRRGACAAPPRPMAAEGTGRAAPHGVPREPGTRLPRAGTPPGTSQSVC